MLVCFGAALKTFGFNIETSIEDIWCQSWFVMQTQHGHHSFSCMYSNVGWNLTLKKNVKLSLLLFIYFLLCSDVGLYPILSLSDLFWLSKLLMKSQLEQENIKHYECNETA